MDEKQRIEMLEAAVRDAVESRTPSPAEARLEERHAPPRSRTRPWVLALLLVWALIGWVWASRPAWVFGHTETRVISAQEEEARLRFALYLQRARVDDWIRRQGQVPAALSAVGAVEEGVTLTRVGSGYELTGRLGALELQLSDRMNADSFLGQSLELLRRQAAATR